MEFLDELRSLKEQLKFNARIKNVDGYRNIVIAGMGGSGIVGMILQELYTKKPVSLVNDYKMPDFVSSNTLVVAISYSGNTEETISSAKDAKRKGAYVVTMSSGGIIEDFGDEHIALPKVKMQPRSAIGFMLMPLLKSFGLMNDSSVKKTYNFLSQMDDRHEDTMKIAKDIFNGNKIPVVYGMYPFKAVAYRWKTQFNENAKVLAYSSSFPELNHNDTMALLQTYRKNRFYFLTFEPEFGRIKKRIKLTSELTSTYFKVIKPRGNSTAEKLFYLIHYGDYVSYNLAVLRKVSPTDISAIEKLKKRLEKIK